MASGHLERGNPPGAETEKTERDRGSVAGKWCVCGWRSHGALLFRFHARGGGLAWPKALICASIWTQ